ncbi:Uncharacterized protein APZ42_007401 [Daphnia magna]|uniref:Uncharacterized protein n=1 Tax=Daphnia magna TaxID=35525 RepID=A0A164FBB2_9CRUS|nr:Uncharacterized protein APZ42_007401 [Daphnia magna]
MAWELDSGSLGCLPTYPTSSDRVVVYGTRLSCPGNSTVCRLNPCQVPHFKSLFGAQLPRRNSPQDTHHAL